MSDPTFYFTVLLTTVVLLLPVVAWRFYRSDVHPTLADEVRLLQRHSTIKPRDPLRPFSGRRSRYVFSAVCISAYTQANEFPPLKKKMVDFEA